MAGHHKRHHRDTTLANSDYRAFLALRGKIPTLAPPKSGE